jgi:hypothetical protein
MRRSCSAMVATCRVMVVALVFAAWGCERLATPAQGARVATSTGADQHGGDNGRIPSGTLLWAREFFQRGNDGPLAILPDLSGGMLLLSELNGEAEVGGVRLSATSDGDLLMARFAARGRLAWAQSLQTPRTNFASMCVNAVGDVFVLGDMQPRYGDASLVLIKLGRDGKRLWTRQFPNRHVESVTLEVSSGGQLFMTGQLGRSVDFGGGELHLPDTGLLVPQTGDWFIAGFDAAGQHVSSRLLGRAVVKGMATSKDRFVVAARTTEESLDLGEGHRVGRGNFVAAFDGDGKVAWGRPIDGDVVGAVADSAGSIRLLVHAPSFSSRCHNARTVKRVSLLTLGADGTTIQQETIRYEGKFVVPPVPARGTSQHPTLGSSMPRCVPGGSKLVLFEDGRVAVIGEHGPVVREPNRAYLSVFDAWGRHVRTWRGQHESAHPMTTVGQDGSIFELVWDPLSSGDDSLRSAVAKYAW